MKIYKFNLLNLLWDLWCMISLVGIWPRFIEPKLLLKKRLKIHLPKLPKDLQGLRIVQISDVHFDSTFVSHRFDKLIQFTRDYAPDLILFTGDFINFSSLRDSDRLLEKLKQLHAKQGCYAILGNHDYQNYITVADDGDYATLKCAESSLKKGLARLFCKPKISGKIKSDSYQPTLHTDLMTLLEKASIQVLHNESKKIKIGETYLNLCGLGDYMAGWTLPKKAFQNYDKNFPGIVMVHNPDALSCLDKFPGDITLCGHTHGGQINLPWLVDRFTLLEDPRYRRGLHRIRNRWVYITTGVGSIMKFRWFSPPEIVLLTLETDG